MENNKLLNKLEALTKDGKWNHCFELADGIQTIPREDIPKGEGSNFKKWERITSLINESHFTNKKILDVGCSDGYFSFMTSKFAKEVEGIDLDSSRIKKANFIKSYFNLNNCNFSNKNINEFINDEFDIVLLLGILHRLPDPISSLNTISKICNEILIEYKCSKSKKNLAYYGGGQKKSNNLNRLYFLFSPNCLETILQNLGYKIIATEKISFFNKLKFPRHIIHAKKT